MQPSEEKGLMLLKTGLEDFLSKKPKRSMRWVEQHSRVSRKFLSKVRGGTEEGLTSNEKKFVLDLTAFFIKNKVNHNIIFDIQKHFLGSFSKEGVRKLSESTESLDRYMSIVLLLCCHHNGYSKGEIETLVLHNTDPAIEGLLEMGFIVEQEGRFKTAEDNIIFSDKFSKNAQRTLIEFLDMKKKDFNHGHVVTERLNKETIEYIVQLYFELASKISDLAIDPKNRGDIPFFSFGACDVFPMRSSP